MGEEVQENETASSEASAIDVTLDEAAGGGRET